MELIHTGTTTKKGYTIRTPRRKKRPGTIYHPKHGGTINCFAFFHDYETGEPFCDVLDDVYCLKELTDCVFKMPRETVKGGDKAWDAQHGRRINWQKK